MRGSIFGKVGRVASGHLRSRDCSSLIRKDAITKEEAEMSSVTGVFIQGCFVKGIIAYVGFHLGFSLYPRDPVKDSGGFQETYAYKLKIANDKNKSLQRDQALLNKRLTELEKTKARLEEALRRNN
ncbi:hypothetical protein ISN44_As12g009080 [Arabidopsis suecica]|uniref:Uncharacterized protein n=1 Tax=Arabidopsis suecica TaxID=45249 RepID=A0A8T1YH95_ARASU|nr:hypothetical protein ISN44_As12g009080 [Arabidopsis suecica]KAG7545447.1 hypothetical protein ISN44_As12g009080 [Arabidopsis suecica]